MRVAEPLNLVQFATACLVAAFLAVAAPAAVAQTGEAGHQFTTQEIESFARASLEVEQLNQEWMPRLEEAETQAEAEALRREAVAQLAEAIEAEGITMETYGAIIEEAQTNPDLVDEIDQHRRGAE